MSSATTKDGLSDDTLHNTVPSFTLLKIKYKIVIKTVKFGWSQSLTGLSMALPFQELENVSHPLMSSRASESIKMLPSSLSVEGCIQ